MAKDRSIKELHMASDMASLESRSDLKLPKSTTYDWCLKSLEKLDIEARSARHTKDEEMEFFFLHRYLILCSYLSVLEKNNNVGKSRNSTIGLTEKGTVKKAQENLSRYGDLRNTLIKRYKEAAIAKKLPAVPSEEPKKPSRQLRPTVFSPTAGIKAANDKGTVECSTLFSLIESKTLKELVLIFDVRPASDFKASHLTCPNVLNIPAEILSVGMSANSLSKRLEDPKLWDKRGEANLLVIMDWSWSSTSPHQHSSKALVLKNIMTRWDPLTSYRSNPVILDGGYEGIIERYPMITSDPKVEIPRVLSTSDSSAVAFSSLDYPMEELEPRMTPPPKLPEVPPPSPSPGGKGDVSSVPTTPHSAPAVFDRSNKPNLPTKTPSANINQLMDELDDFPSDEEPPAEPVQPNSSSSSHTNSVIEPTGRSDTTPMDDSSDEDVNQYQSELEGSVGSTPIHDSRLSVRPNAEDPKVLDPKSMADNMRKLKPTNNNNNNNRTNGTRPSSNIHHAWPSSTSNATDVSLEPLKDGPSSGGILRRSSSSPNISKLGDDESLGSTPNVNRAVKPTVPRKQFIFNERLDSTFGKTAAPGLTGLKNFANNCYMNSIVQCLNNTEPLVTELIQNDRLQINQWRNNRRQGRIAQEMIQAFHNMWSGEIRVYSIRELKSLMGGIKDIFKGAMHQDSNEFLIILLEHLHEDLNVPAEVGTLAGAVEETGEKAWGEFRRKNCSVIQRLFYGQHKSTVRCESCGHESATFEQFFNLFVPIPANQNSVSLNDCLQLYMSGERISGWKCPECKTERNATKKIDISRLPPVMVIALKRFTQENDSWLHKKENLVTYPLDNLDMSRFTVPGSEQRHKMYSLYAMSIHSGTLQSGHYRAICKNVFTKRWYLFDDSTVEPLSESSVLNNPEVYILFYISKPS